MGFWFEVTSFSFRVVLPQQASLFPSHWPDFRHRVTLSKNMSSQRWTHENIIGNDCCYPHCFTVSDTKVITHCSATMYCEKSLKFRLILPQIHMNFMMYANRLPILFFPKIDWLIDVQDFFSLVLYNSDHLHKLALTFILWVKTSGLSKSHGLIAVLLKLAIKLSNILALHFCQLFVQSRLGKDTFNMGKIQVYNLSPF